jgi:hypothetical protein
MFVLAPAEQGFGAQALPLRARVIAHGELAGFGPFGGVAVEKLKSRAPNREGSPWAMQLRSTADAQNELFREAQRDKARARCRE